MNVLDLAIYGLPLAISIFGAGVYIGWTERGRWDAHKADATKDESEEP